MKMEIERFDAKTEEETIIDLDIAIKEIYKCLSSSPYGFSYNDLSTEDKIKDQLLAGKDIDTFEATYCLHLINCPNCADQASIAAPGQTVLCKTHSDDELHFSEMRKFFDEYIQEMILKPHMPFCSRCGADSPDYVLLLRTSDGSPLNFAACANCRDELTLKQNAARAALKRIVA